ncbi:MAG: zinc-ribbon domain-containing protein [Smithella sp.]|nr:zinc-ribbon domain-containing protein [Smithella sp.]
MGRQISPERKGLFYAGLVIQVIGGCLFAVPFIAIPIIMMRMHRGSDSPGPGVMLVAFIGFALIAIGGAMRGIAAKGVAGSGLVLDPEKARRDLEPWTRMGGGMVKDALDEADIDLKNLGGGSRPEKVIMIKCRECGKLNEEDSKFCQECGKPI